MSVHQVKALNILRIKERIIQVADYHNIGKEKFLKELGVAASGFRGDNLQYGVSSDLLLLIVKKYNVSAHWLLTGEGEMYDDHYGAAEESAIYRKEQEFIQYLKKSLEDKDKIIEMLERDIRRLQTNIPQSKKGAG